MLNTFLSIFGEEPISVHVSLSLDLHLAPDLGAVSPHIVEQHLGLVGHLDHHRLPGAPHPRGHVHRVAKQTIPRHLRANNASSSWPRVNSNPRKQLSLGKGSIKKEKKKWEFSH